MNNDDREIDFIGADLASDSRLEIFDSPPWTEPGGFMDEYLSFEFEAMSEVPYALAAFVTQQYDFNQ